MSQSVMSMGGNPGRLSGLSPARKAVGTGMGFLAALEETGACKKGLIPLCVCEAPQRCQIGEEMPPLVLPLGESTRLNTSKALDGHTAKLLSQLPLHCLPLPS